MLPKPNTLGTYDMAVRATVASAMSDSVNRSLCRFESRPVNPCQRCFHLMGRAKNRLKWRFLLLSAAAAAVGSCESKAEEYQALNYHAVSESQGWNYWSPISDLPSWVDHLPVKLSVDQSLRYNDNILLLPKGTILPPGQTPGDYYSVTTPAYNFRYPIGAQSFFSNGSYTFTRYNNDTSLNTDNYSIDGGMDWRLTSRCSGQLIAASSLAQSPFYDQISFSINNVKTDSVNGTGRCKFAPMWAAILESGRTETQNSLLASRLNDNDATRTRAGLEYQVAALDTFRVQATRTETDYFNRGPVAANSGLAINLDQRALEAYYKRIFSPRFEIEGSYGRTEFISDVSQAQSFPIYAATVRWKPTPKLAFEATTSLSYGPTSTVLADFQRIKLYALNANYRFSPVLSFVASVSQQAIENSTASGALLAPVLANYTVLTGLLQANYRVSPFINAVLSYSFTDRTFSVTNQHATSNLYLVGLKYIR
jgi:hypothetical protein